MTTKKEIIKFYAERNGIENICAEEKIDKFISILKKALSENEKITFKKFGIFEVKETKERDICDPRRINKKNHAKPRKYIKFTVSRLLKDELHLEEETEKWKIFYNFEINKIYGIIKIIKEIKEQIGKTRVMPILALVFFIFFEEIKKMSQRLFHSADFFIHKIIKHRF